MRLDRIQTVVFLLLLIVVAVLLSQRDSQTPPTSAAPTEPAAPAAVPVAPSQAVVAEPQPAAKTAEPDRSRQLELPDGTFVDALNGATNVAALKQFWGADRPWSPIVGVERGKDIDWYRHADGSYSTTQMVWRQDLGRYDAMTRVAHPGPEAPAAGGAAR